MVMYQAWLGQGPRNLWRLRMTKTHLLTAVMAAVFFAGTAWALPAEGAAATNLVFGNTYHTTPAYVDTAAYAAAGQWVEIKLFDVT